MAFPFIKAGVEQVLGGYRVVLPCLLVTLGVFLIIGFVGDEDKPAQQHGGEILRQPPRPSKSFVEMMFDAFRGQFLRSLVSFMHSWGRKGAA